MFYVFCDFWKRWSYLCEASCSQFLNHLASVITQRSRSGDMLGEKCCLCFLLFVYVLLHSELKGKKTLENLRLNVLEMVLFVKLNSSS